MDTPRWGAVAMFTLSVVPVPLGAVQCSQQSAEGRASFSITRCNEVGASTAAPRCCCWPECATSRACGGAHGTALAVQWLDSDRSDVLRVDGHVKIYTGGGRLPPHYVPRLKLILKVACSYFPPRPVPPQPSPEDAKAPAPLPASAHGASNLDNMRLQRCPIPSHRSPSGTCFAMMYLTARTCPS